LRKTKDISNIEIVEANSSEEKYTENSGSWFQLLSSIKRSNGGAHVDVLKRGVKNQSRGFSARDSRLHEAKRIKKERSKFFEEKPDSVQELPEGVHAEMRSRNLLRAQKLFLVAKHEKRLLLLEGIYNELLGDNFCYHIGCMVPELDLFFLNVLCNRMEMAEVFWRRSPLPITSAISAAYLLREMAKSDRVEPAGRILMLENAYLFEKKAVNVMKSAQKKNQQFATLALDCVVNCHFLWMDTTILDLAMQSNCRIFVQECCREAIDARMYGDIDPYQNSFLWIALNVFPLFGLWAAIGSRFPCLEGWFPSVKFKIPPVDNVVRASTQRRLMPRGFPSRPNENPILSSPPYEYKAPRCDAAYPAKCRLGVYHVCLSCARSAFVGAHVSVSARAR
jgi:hypothetical protein